MRSVISILLLLLLSSCATDSDSDTSKVPFEGSFAQAGLSDTAVNSFSRFEEDIYAAAEGGLFRSSQISGDFSWSPIGLPNEEVLKIVFLPGGKLLAAIRIDDFSSGIASMYLSEDGGLNWHEWVNNYGGETGKYTWVESIATASIPSDTLFARVSGHTVARSVNGGREWQTIYGNWDGWGGAAFLILSDPFQKGRVFAGGVNAFSRPYLLYSPDYGENWESLNILEEEAVCYDLLTHPSESHTLLVALGGAVVHAEVIRKSADGGQSWETVFEGTNTYALEQSIRNNKVVYASGQNERGTLFFAVSNDFGDSWQTVEFEDGPSGIRVNDMLSVLQNGREVLYFATSRGVYSYTFED